MLLIALPKKSLLEHPVNHSLKVKLVSAFTQPSKSHRDAARGFLAIIPPLTAFYLSLHSSGSARPLGYGQLMGTLLLVCLLPLDPAKRLLQPFTPEFENMKASLLLAPGNLTSQPTTPFIDTFLNLFSQYYKYSNSCQKPFPAASNHMLTGLKPISHLWEWLPMLFLIS